MSGKNTHINIMDAQSILQKANAAATEISALFEQIKQTIADFKGKLAERYNAKIRETDVPQEKEELSRTVKQMLLEIGNIPVPDIPSIIREIADSRCSSHDLHRTLTKEIKILEKLFLLIFEKTEAIEKMDSTFQIMMENLAQQGDKESALKNSDLIEYINLEIAGLEEKFNQIFFLEKNIQQQIEALEQSANLINQNYEEVSYQLSRLSRKESGQPIPDQNLLKALSDLEIKLGLIMNDLAETKKSVASQISTLGEEIRKLNLWKSQLRYTKDAFEAVLKYWSGQVKKPVLTETVVSIPVKDLSKEIPTIKNSVDDLLEKISKNCQKNPLVVELPERENEPASSGSQADATDQNPPVENTATINQTFKYPPVAIAIAVLNTYTYKNGRAFETIYNAAQRAGLVSEEQKESFRSCLIEASETTPAQLNKTQKTVGFKKTIIDIFIPTDFGQRMTIHLAKRMITPEVTETIKLCYREDQERMQKTKKRITQRRKKEGR